jgi:hypothetical protein
MPSLYEVLSKFVEEQKRDQDFLRQMGWRRCWGETCKIKGFTSLCNNVWMNPITGEKRPQVFSMAAHQCERAIDIAAEERLKELQIPYISTIDEGSIIFKTDGKNIFQ